MILENLQFWYAVVIVSSCADLVYIALYPVIFNEIWLLTLCKYSIFISYNYLLNYDYELRSKGGGAMSGPNGRAVATLSVQGGYPLVMLLRRQSTSLHTVTCCFTVIADKTQCFSNKWKTWIQET